MDRPNQGLHDTHMTKNKPPSSAPAVDHGHDHEHVHALLPPEPALRVKALESILVEKGLVDPAALDAIIDFYERDIGPHIGAGLVARAWADDTFRATLLADADAVIDGLGHGGRQGEHVVVVENTPSVHNMVVCTLCSCYPWPLLGIPPAWYKSDAYRSRAVREPRAVLAEFGVTLPADTSMSGIPPPKSAIWCCRCAPKAPPMDAAELAALVNRDAMIGTGLPLQPGDRQ